MRISDWSSDVCSSDLTVLPGTILPYPERTFGPRQSRICAAAGRRNRGEHAAAVRIDLLDAIFGELEQMLAVERRSRMRGDVDRTQCLSALRTERVQFVADGDPDMLTVIGDAAYAVDTCEGAIFADDSGR